MLSKEEYLKAEAKALAYSIINFDIDDPDYKEKFRVIKVLAQMALEKIDRE